MKRSRFFFQSSQQENCVCPVSTIMFGMLDRASAKTSQYVSSQYRNVRGIIKHTLLHIPRNKISSPGRTRTRKLLLSKNTRKSTFVAVSRHTKLFGKKYRYKGSLVGNGVFCVFRWNRNRTNKKGNKKRSKTERWKCSLLCASLKQKLLATLN